MAQVTAGSILPPPEALGIPGDLFPEWRPLQEEAILRAADSPKRFVVFAAPTGFGKSIVYMAASALANVPTAFLTSTKGLQDQLSKDFSPMGLVDMRGMNNYECLGVRPENQSTALGFPIKLDVNRQGGRAAGCEEGPCHMGIRCKLKAGGCLYYDQHTLAKSSDLVVTNYTYWLSITNFSEEGLGERRMLVLDEAHDAPDTVSDFLTVTIEPYEVEHLMETRFLEAGAGSDQWREWATFHKRRVDGGLEVLKLDIKSAQDGGGRVPTAHFRRMKELKALSRKLSMLTGMQATWVSEVVGGYHSSKGAMKFSPIWPAAYCEKYLFRGIPKVVMVSATLTPKTLECLGVPADQVDFKEWPSSFPVSRRPFIHVPTVQMNHRNEQLMETKRKMVNRVDQIVGPRQDRKGIIHSVSYARAQFIQRNSDWAHQMMVPDSSNTRATVQRFKVAPPGTVLVSPAVTTGYDFPYTQCEYQVIIKIPFPDTRPEVMKARTHLDPEYYHYIAYQNLIQMVGRGMRAGDDRCETLILDDNARWFLFKYKKFAPKWFMDSVVMADYIPQPPEKLQQPHTRGNGRG